MNLTISQSLRYILSHLLVHVPKTSPCKAGKCKSELRADSLRSERHQDALQNFYVFFFRFQESCVMFGGGGEAWGKRQAAF